MEEIVKKYFTREEAVGFTSTSAYKRQHTEVHDEKLFLRTLSAYPSYTLQKSCRRRFERSRTIVSESTMRFELTHPISISSQCIMREKSGFYARSIFSKKAYAISFPTKQTFSVEIRLQELFARMKQLPVRIRTGRACDFHNREVKQYLESEGINRFSTFNQETKAAVFER